MEQILKSINEWVTTKDENGVVDEDVQEWINAVEANEEQRQLLLAKKALEQQLSMLNHKISAPKNFMGNGMTCRLEPGLRTVAAPTSCPKEEPQPMDPDEHTYGQQFSSSEIINCFESKTPSASPFYDNMTEDDTGIFSGYEGNPLRTITVLELMEINDEP